MVARAVVGLLCIALLACGSEPPPPAAPAPPASPASSHGHEAPHGGVLVELGDHFAQLEFVLDPSAGTLTMFVLDGEAAAAVRIAQPSVAVTFDAPGTLAGQTLQLAAKANVLTGETMGDSSQFEVTHEALKNQTTFTARVVDLVVKGQTFRDLAVTRAP